MDWLSISDGLVMDSHGQNYIGVRLSIDGDGLVMDWGSNGDRLVLDW